MCEPHQRNQYCLCRRETALQFVGAGILPSRVAAIMGIPASTIRGWIKKAESD